MPIRAAARRVSSLRNDAEADVSTPKLKVDSKVPTSQQQNVEDLLVPLASEVGQGQSAKLDRDGRLQVDRWTQPQHEPAQRTTEDEQRSANWLLLQPQMYFSFLANYGEDRKVRRIDEFVAAAEGALDSWTFQLYVTHSADSFRAPCAGKYLYQFDHVICSVLANDVPNRSVMRFEAGYLLTVTGVCEANYGYTPWNVMIQNIQQCKNNA